MQVIQKIKIITLLTLMLLVDNALSDQYKKILIVDSYHPEYSWSQATNRGFVTRVMEEGMLNQAELEKVLQVDEIKNTKLHLKRIWLDTKRNKNQGDLIKALNNIVVTVNDFKPDIIAVGDDNATELVGNEYYGTNYPIVFWGVNGSPLRYGFLETLQYPAANITGVYQSMYHQHSMRLLTELVPTVNKIAVIADDSKTSRSHLSFIEKLENDEKIPVEIIDVFITDSYAEWQKKILAVQKKVDALFILNFATLKDKQGKQVPQHDVATWYTKNVKIPEAVGLNFYVNEGLLCNVEDSGYMQGYEAAKILLRVLTKEEDIKYIPAISPPPGRVLVNKKRAQQLGITIPKDVHIDEIIE